MGRTFFAPAMGRWLLASLVSLLCAACSSLEKRVYQVELINKTSLPLSVGLVKNGPPLEKDWTAPENIAIGAPHLSDRHWGQLLQPGERTVLGPTPGLFDRGVDGFVRVYVGDPTIEQLIAFSRRDPDRLDLFLVPGRNAYLITEPAGKLNAVRLKD